MSHELNAFIRECLIESKKIKRPHKKTARIICAFPGNLRHILNWLQLNKACKSIGEIKKAGNIYYVTVRVSSTSGRQKVKDLVKSRFGNIGRVE